MFTPSGSIIQTRPSRSVKSRSNAQLQVARGRATSECWGPIGLQFWEVSQDLRRSCRAGEEQSGQHSAESEDQKGFLTPFCKGLGLFCNGFQGCGALGPHECNLSDLSHTINREQMVKGKMSYGFVLYCCKARSLHKLLVLHILQANVLITERGEESALVVGAQRLQKRRERLRSGAQQELCIPLY